jgi:CheY-like chemotaxis protein
MNLVINATHAMPNGGELFIKTTNVEIDEIYASTKNGVKPGNYIMVAISDTGVGIPSDILDKIFDPFFTTKEKTKGTGLGLSTAYGIIKQHGGNIWVYSEPEYGTTFKIYLPTASNKAVEKKAPKETHTAVPGSATILVVEDDSVVREVVCSMLKQNGYRVIESDSPQSAIELSKKHTGDIHLLLTDVVMPGMKGPEVYQLIFNIHPETKVLYMSGYPQDFISRQGILHDGVQFISKPLTINSLLKKVSESILG